MKCYIVKDLLPNYIDNLTSEDINIEIDTHLKQCRNCRITYERMQSSNAQEILLDDKEIDFLKKLRSMIQRKYVTVVLFTCMILVGLMFFARNYEMSLPYEKEHMTTETYQAVKITNSYDFIQWEDVDLLDFETTKNVLSTDCKCISLIRLVREKGSVDESIDSYGRTIYRDGQEIRVVYYCYKKKLWNKLFPGREEDSSIQISTADIYGDSLYQEDYQPQMREIYYLPTKNMNKFEKLSDDEFDALKENAVLVWRGTV